MAAETTNGSAGGWMTRHALAHVDDCRRPKKSPRKESTRHGSAQQNLGASRGFYRPAHLHNHARPPRTAACGPRLGTWQAVVVHEHHRHTNPSRVVVHHERAQTVDTSERRSITGCANALVTSVNPTRTSQQRWRLQGGAKLQRHRWILSLGHGVDQVLRRAPSGVVLDERLTTLKHDGRLFHTLYR